ncbi:ABC transporter permease [Mycolicibacterium nivoides]|uniref:ABC transporter permease n=1 Tax=Mycolicibacterium nivoides TaxID=2487344 RepID=UPI003C2B75B6
MTRRPLAFWIGVLLAGLPIVVALIGPLVATTGQRGPAFVTSEAWTFGTDSEGRDVLTEVLRGGTNLLLCAVAATVLCNVIAVPWAMTAALASASDRRQWLDELLMRPLDVLMSVPTLMMLLLVATLAGPSAPVLITTVAVLLLPDAIRLMRAAALKPAGSDAMQALLLQRATRTRRLIQYLARAIAPVIVTDVGLRFVGAIYLVASASFIGLSADAAGTDWAVMVDRNRSGIFLAPWGVVLPAALIAALAVGVNLMADEGIRRHHRPHNERTGS